MKLRRVFLSLVVMIAFGCGDDDDATTAATATATVAATETTTIAPTPTATPPIFTPTPDEDPEHRELEIGSTEDGGGALDAEFEFERPISLFFDTCLGGEGDDCEGGVRLYSAVNPGFVAHGHDDEHALDNDDDEGEHTDTLVELLDGTEINIEVVAIDEGLSMMIDGETLDAAGQQVDLGEAPDFHGDAETFLGISGDAPEAEFHFTFRLTTTSSRYTSSEEKTLRFRPVAAARGEEEEREHD